MSFQKVQILLKHLPQSVVVNTRVTFTATHQEYLNIFGLPPGCYSLNQLVSIWNQILAQPPSEEACTAIDDASYQFFRLLGQVYRMKQIRMAYPNLSTKNFGILFEEFNTTSDAPSLSLPPLPQKDARFRALLILIGVGIGLNLLVWVPTWLQPVFQPRPTIDQENQD